MFINAKIVRNDAAENVNTIARSRNAVELINAMRSHEEATARCIDYITPEVNATCRGLMINWCFTVVDALDLSRETVGIAVSILDRYLSSGKGKSFEAVKCTKSFQRSVVTTLFMAIKIHESVVLGIKFLIKICQGVYNETDIIATELIILKALEWRVYCASISPMEYVRHYVDLLPEEYNDVAVTDHILKNAARLVDIATSDIHFSTCRASSIGMACLAGALDDMGLTSSSDTTCKEAIWTELSSKLGWDIESNEVRQAEMRLHSMKDSSRCESWMSDLTCRPVTPTDSIRCHQPA